MKNSEELREIVREKYAEIAVADASENKSCCTPACCTDGNKNSMADSYADVKGYEPIADLGLGCGLPTEFAAIKPGDTVVDLGSGAGNDCFVARAETGEKGKVIGIDMTPEMIKRARKIEGEADGEHNEKCVLAFFTVVAILILRKGQSNFSTCGGKSTEKKL